MSRNNLTNRTAARSRKEVPPAVRKALNAGTIETINLVEWLVVDMESLLKAILPEIGLKKESNLILAAYRPLRDEGIMHRMKGIGTILFETLHGRANREKVFERLATHRADLPRQWAGYWLAADRTIPLKARLDRMRRFAADPHMAVRECAWTAFRPYVAEELAKGLRLLKKWVADADPNVRRCAVEATRPRGVWAAHIVALKQDPEPGLALLEPVRSDPSRYVQNAAGNWLNDASKSQPAWVRRLCRRWEKESPTKETEYIVRRALRTLHKEEGGKKNATH